MVAPYIPFMDVAASYSMSHEAGLLILTCWIVFLLPDSQCNNP